MKRLLVAASAVAVLAVAGCGGTSTPPTSPTTHGMTATASSAAPVAAPAASTPTGTERATLAHDGPLRVYRAPGGAVLRTLPARTPYGSSTTLLVDRHQGAWVHVLLPTRPNGSAGWVRAADVKLASLASRITVDLHHRTITVVTATGRTVRGPVAIGAPKTATPTGRYYVTDRVRPSNPHGAYGAFALGLSAHSATLTTFGKGDGQIGIHGTNEQDSIGKPVSHGCVRVTDTVTRALEGVPLGTPVTIG